MNSALSASILIAPLLLTHAVAVIPADGHEGAACPIQAREYTRESLPEGTNVVDCKFIGVTVVESDLARVSVPEPGRAIRGFFHEDQSAASLYVAVSKDGYISYQQPVYVSHDAPGAKLGRRRLSPAACDDTTYDFAGYFFGASVSVVSRNQCRTNDKFVDGGHRNSHEGRRSERNHDQDQLRRH